MNMTNLYAVLICLIPIVLAVIFAKRYNFIHGLIAYIFFTFVLHSCLHQFGAKLPADLLAALTNLYGNGSLEMYGSHNMISFFNDSLRSVPFLTDILKGENQKWVLIGLYLGVFIISQIISSVIASARRRKIRRLKQQAKRY